MVGSNQNTVFQTVVMKANPLYHQEADPIPAVDRPPAIEEDPL